MNISEALDMIDDTLEKAWSLPLSGGKCVVDIQKMTDLIGEIRLSLPGELKQARLIVTDRQDILSDAKKEAEQIVRDAQLKAKHLTNEQEIIKQAQARANQMLTQAHTQSNQIKKMTSDYIERTLSNSEEALIKNLHELKEAHAQIRKSTK